MSLAAKAVRRVLLHLADREARLVTTEAAETDATGGTVQVAYGAPIREWKRLRAWLDADRAGSAHSRPPGRRWRVGRLPP
jgi:hypothetical protein